MSASILSDQPDSRYADAWGAALSLGCVIHCLAAPALLLVIPAQLATWFWSPTVHAVVAAFTACFVLAAIGPGYRRHERPIIPFLATLGCGLVVLGSLVPCGLACELSTGALAWSRWFTIDGLVASWTPLGAALLVVTHLWNGRLSRFESGC